MREPHHPGVWSHVRGRLLGVGFLLLAVGCGEGETSHTPTFGFSTDHPDLYGMMSVEVDGQDALELGYGDDLPSCAEPLQVKGGFWVASSNGFRWYRESAPPAESCVDIELSIETNQSGLLLVAIHNPEVLPAVVEMDGNPVGTIEQACPYSADALGTMFMREDDIAASRRLVADIALGGGGLLLARPPGKHELSIVLADGSRGADPVRFRDGAVAILSKEYEIVWDDL